MTTVEPPYSPRRAAVSEWLDVRGLRLHIRRWPRPGAPKLFLLHGWMDAAASFQFLVDALKQDWDVIAPDLRGFGESEWDAGGYFFAQYLADLDALLEHYSRDEPARLVGHSLGGNLVCLYAGARPERVAALANLDGFGLRDAPPEEAPERLAKWLHQLRYPEHFRTYSSFDGLVARLQAENPSLSSDRAAFLAEHLGEENGLGGVIRAADPAHLHVSPVLYRFAEVAAVWRRITAPVLVVLADDPRTLERLNLSREEVRQRFDIVPRVQIETLHDTGHNLHIEQPERLAVLLEAFFASSPGAG